MSPANPNPLNQTKGGAGWDAADDQQMNLMELGEKMEVWGRTGGGGVGRGGGLGRRISYCEG